MASDGIWEAVDLLGVLVKYENLSIQHFSYQDGKPNISQVLIYCDYLSLVETCDIQWNQSQI